MLDFDQFLQDFGEFGRYQQFVMWLLCVPACLINAYNGYGVVFLMYTPEHRCGMPANYSNSSEVRVVAEQCHLVFFKVDKDNPTNDTNDQELYREPCSTWTYDTTYFDSTVITKWDLVCDKAIQSTIVISVFSAGAVIGCIIYSYIQDKWGRKVSFQIGLITYLIGAIASLYVPSLVAFAVLRFVCALSSLASWNNGYVWAMEYVGSSKRTLLTTVMCVAYALSMMSMSLLAYLLPNWVHLGLAMSVPFVVVISYQWLVHESPRWLLSQGKVAEAQRVVDCMTRWGNKKLEPDVLAKRIATINFDIELRALQNGTTTTAATTAQTETPATETRQTTAILDLFRGPNIRKKTLLVMLAYVSNEVAYTCIAYNSENLGDNMYITWLLTSTVEAPAGLAFMFFAQRYGRVLPLGLGMILGGIFCILTAPGEEFMSYWIVVTFAMIGKFVITIAFNVIGLLAGEIFPTVSRGMGVGVTSVLGDVGNIAMPYIIYSSETYKMLPMIVIGILAVVGGLGGLFLPETLNECMPETLEQAEQSGVVGLKTLKGHFKRVCNCRKAQSDVS